MRCITIRGHVVWQRPASENTSDLPLPSCAALLGLVRETAWLWVKPCSRSGPGRGILGQFCRLILKDRTPAGWPHREPPDSFISLPQRTWNFSVFLKQPRRELLNGQPADSNTVPSESGSEKLASNLPVTALGVTEGRATIQQASIRGEVLDTNLNTCPFTEGKPIEAF